MAAVTIEIDDLRRLIIEAVRDAMRAELRPTLSAPPGSYVNRVNAALENHERNKLKKKEKQALKNRECRGQSLTALSHDHPNSRWHDEIT